MRVDQLAEGVVVHMMKKGVLGKAKPAPVDLGKYVMVAFERTHDRARDHAQREARQASRTGCASRSPSTRATWQSITASGDAETEPNPLDSEDFAGIRRLGEGARRRSRTSPPTARSPTSRSAARRLTQLPEPRVVPMELLHQLTPLARTIRAA